jgi:hypothetical protein
MKLLKPSATAALLALSAVSAQAQYAGTPITPVRPYLGIFLTGGGDDLATASVDSGFGSRTESIEAGGVLDLKAGIEFLLNPAFSMRGSVGYHFDSISADNGDIRFTRIPFEVMAIWHPGPPLHLGLGMRYAMGASYVATGRGAVSPTGRDSVDFEANPGIVLEGEYQFSPAVGVALRLVSESYKAKFPSTGKFDGTHVGIGLNFHF